MPNLNAMTQEEFIARVEDGNVEAGFTNLKVFNYYATAEVHIDTPSCHYAVVHDRDSLDPKRIWRVAYKFCTMDTISVSGLMSLREAKKALIGLMFCIFE